MVFRHRGRAYRPVVRRDWYCCQSCAGFPIKRSRGWCRAQHLTYILRTGREGHVLGSKESGAGLRAEDTAWWDWQTSLEETCEGRPLPAGIGYLCGAYGAERLYVKPTMVRHGL